MSKEKRNMVINEVLNQISSEEQQKTDKKMELAMKIAQAIKNNGLKKSEFAERLGKRPSEISKWLSGTHNFTVDTLMELERELKINLLDVSEREYSESDNPQAVE